MTGKISGYFLSVAITLFLVVTAAPATSQSSCESACSYLLQDSEAQDSCVQRCGNQGFDQQPLQRKNLSHPSSGSEFACVQLPVSCSSNSDCTCSSCCGDMAGVHLCQPNC